KKSPSRRCSNGAGRYASGVGRNCCKYAKALLQLCVCQSDAVHGDSPMQITSTLMFETPKPGFWLPRSESVAACAALAPALLAPARLEARLPTWAIGRPVEVPCAVMFCAFRIWSAKTVILPAELMPASPALIVPRGAKRNTSPAFGAAFGPAPSGS